jgi:ABC-type branched-subunit amino acid transport system substrate-binding protein
MSRHLIAPIVMILALAVAACGKGGADEGGGSAGGSGSADTVKTGPGASADTITLGYLPDLSGVFAPNGKAMMEGAKLYWDAKNKAGGICGRKIVLSTQDTGYDPQKAVAAYRQMSGDVIGLGLVLGSPITSALLPSVQSDGMFLNFAGWTSDILPNANVAIAGTTYDIEAIDAVDFLMKEKGLKDGDTIGHLYFEGDYGENALKGSKYAASKHGLKLVEQKITPADQDMTGQVTAFKKAKVKAILFSAAPPQAASLAGVAAAQKLDVPIVANGPGWTPQLLTTPAADALAANYYVVSSMAPLTVKSAGVQKFLSDYRAAYPKGTPSSNGSLYAYAGAQIADAALTKACANKDLTRKGVLDALHSLTALDTGGTIAGTLDFSDPSRPPGKLVYVAKVSKDAPGGLEALGEPTSAADADGYAFTH